MKNSFYYLPVCLALAGCGQFGKPASEGPSGVQKVVLSAAQKQIVTAGVREMVSKGTVNGGESARLASLRAFTLQPGGGVHVCGDVSYQLEAGKGSLFAPYYVELEEIEGNPSAKRGQVGFDELKKSKVTFMCRHLSTP